MSRLFDELSSDALIVFAWDESKHPRRKDGEWTDGAAASPGGHPLVGRRVRTPGGNFATIQEVRGDHAVIAMEPQKKGQPPPRGRLGVPIGDLDVQPSDAEIEAKRERRRRIIRAVVKAIA